MNVLLVRGNQRTTGFTQSLTDRFLCGLRSGGAIVDDVDLRSCRIEHCLGCYRCWLATPGRCVIDDDMSGLLERFVAADTIVLSSPLHSYSVSSTMKAFMDRTLPLTKEGVVADDGLFRNTVRDPSSWPCRLALVLVGALRSPGNFDGARRSVQLYCRGLGLQLCGELIRPESHLLPFALTRPKTIRQVEIAFERAGLELATSGTITERTQREASVPISESAAQFERFSNRYWEHARQLGADGTSIERVRESVMGDVGVLLEEMVDGVDAVATANVRASLHFVFPDIARQYTVSIDHGAAHMARGPHASADLTITADALVWTGIFQRRIDARQALSDGRIVLEGDKRLFMRLNRFFPPPSG